VPDQAITGLFFAPIIQAIHSVLADNTPLLHDGTQHSPKHDLQWRVILSGLEKLFIWGSEVLATDLPEILRKHPRHPLGVLVKESSGWASHCTRYYYRRLGARSGRGWSVSVFSCLLLSWYPRRWNPRPSIPHNHQTSILNPHTS
jgi:hypothetical protein